MCGVVVQVRNDSLPELGLIERPEVVAACTAYASSHERDVCHMASVEFALADVLEVLEGFLGW